MTVPGVLAAAIAAGVSVRRDEDRLVLSARKQPDDRLLEELRREKTEIVTYLRGLSSRTDEDWQALFDERAGIMEFDGGMSRSQAEDRAKEEMEGLRRLVRETPNG